MLLYGVYDPVRKIFVDPNPPSPEKIDPPQVTQSPIPEPGKNFNEFPLTIHLHLILTTFQSDDAILLSLHHLRPAVPCR